MGIFRRKKKADASVGSAPDPDLPLEVAQAQRLRSMVRQVFAESGREVSVYADHVVDDQGVELGLWNLAATVRHLPPPDWEEAVRAHVAIIDRSPIAGGANELDDLDERELTVATYARVVEHGSMPGEWHTGVGRPAEGLATVLAVDLPELVSTPASSWWEERGGERRWLATGLANLRALAISDELEHERLELDSGASFEVVMGDSFFTASTGLVVDHLSRRFVGVDPGELGALVAMPFRHQVAFRLLEPGIETVLSLHHLFGFAQRGYAEGAGPVSPHVFWVRGGQWQQVTRVDGDQAAVVVDDELGEALGILEE